MCCDYNIYVVVFVVFLSVYPFSHLSLVLGNKFDHGAEAIVPVLFNLIPNCAKVMATSGVSAIRIIIRVNTRINSTVLFCNFLVSVSTTATIGLLGFH